MHVPASFTVPYLGIIQIDWVIIGLLIIILTATAIRWGTVRTCVIAVTMPVSAFLFSLISSSAIASSVSSNMNSPLMQSGIFIALLVFVYIMTYRMYRSFLGEGERLWLAFVAGLAASFVVIVVWIHTPALASIWEFSKQTQSIFGSLYALWWMIASLLLLGYVRS